MMPAAMQLTRRIAVLFAVAIALLSAQPQGLRAESSTGPQRSAITLAQGPAAGAGPSRPGPTRFGRSRTGSESVEADVDTRAVNITSGFSGTEIVVFGSITYSRQPSPEAGFYDIAIVVEGSNTPLIARRKSNVAGIWVNTDFVRFASLPSYYAVASTRPIEEIASDDLLKREAIGLQHIRMRPSGQSQSRGLKKREIRAFRDAVIRLKQNDGLYLTKPYGVAFIGKSLFRATIALPANVPIGPLTARVYLFRDQKVLSDFTVKVELKRAGLERVLYDFAYLYPTFYGIFAVILAASAGLAASFVFQRR